MPNRGELRRLSVTLRRILVNEEIQTIAAPQIGRIQFRAPISPFATDPINPETIFWQSGGRIGRGFNLSLSILEIDGPTPSFKQNERNYGDFPLAKFLAQNVLFFRGSWANRKAVISYAANYTAAAHTSTPNNPQSKVLHDIEQYVRFSVRLKDGGPEFNLEVDIVDPNYPSYHSSMAKYDSSINSIHLENMATASLLCDSLDLQRLISVIRTEMETESPGEIA